MKEEITHIKKAHGYRNNWKPSDLIEKKLFSFTDSAVLEAYKVKNVVAIEAAFSCISEGRRGGQ